MQYICFSMFDINMNVMKRSKYEKLDVVRPSTSTTRRKMLVDLVVVVSC